MKIITEGLPEATDYFGVIRTMSGVKDCIIVEHGAPGTMTYTQLSFHSMNRETIHGKIFSSGVDENDVVMGSDTRLADAVQWVDSKYNPAMIAVVATAITAVIGLDIDGFCRKLQPGISARLVPFASGGFRGTYFSGIEDGCRALIDTFVKSREIPTEERSVNIIGPTGEAFNTASDLTEIRRILNLMGVSVNTVFPHECRSSDIAAIPSAKLNLVTRDLMVPVGEHIRKACGQGFFYGAPIGIRGTVEWIQKVSALLGIEYPDQMVTEEIARYAFALPEVFSRIQTYDHFTSVIACPFEYAHGLSRLVTEDWGLTVSAVVLPEQPHAPDFHESFAKLGVKEILVNPSDRIFAEMIQSTRPQVLFGNTYHLKLGKSVPIRIHAAPPTPDILTLFDGTPFTGFRGYAHLTQRLVNEAGAHKEVFTP
jgi:light-independent protochlorophyllide reductase B subunit